MAYVAEGLRSRRPIQKAHFYVGECANSLTETTKWPRIHG